MQKVGSFDQFESILTKLSHYIEANYNVGFRFLSAEQWYALNISEQYGFSAEKNISTTRVYHNLNLYLLIHSDGQLACAVNIVNASNLHQQQIDNLTLLIDGIVGGSFNLATQLDILEERQNHMEEDIQEEITPLPRDNVLNMHEFSYLKSKEESPEEKEFYISDLAVFVNGLKHDQIFKIAHEIYTRTDKAGFLELSQLSKDPTFSVEYLNSLGPSCVFVNELVKLTPLERQVLEDYLAQKQDWTNEQALIITGSTLSGRELIERKVISENFYKLISQIQLSHREASLTQPQLVVYGNSVLEAQKDIYISLIVNKMGEPTPVSDDLV